MQRSFAQCSANTRPGSMPLLTEAESAPSKNCYRLVILGSAKVGKTSIVSRFLNNKFDDNYTPTIEDFHRKVYRIKGEAYRLDILDTSGNHPFPAMRRLSFLTGDLFILVFSIDNEESFEEVKRLRDQIIESKLNSPGGSKKKKPGLVPMVIVANKCDKERDRKIDREDIVTFSETLPGCAFVECSAKKNNNVDEVFLKLFILAQLPTEMSPSLHRRVQPNYVSSSSSPSSGRRGMTIRRRLSDACGAVAPNVRRPSIRTDLLILQTRQNLGSTEREPRETSKCNLQ